MCLKEIEESSKDCLSVYDIYDFFECDPQRLRDFFDLEDEKPVEMRTAQFPHCKIGNRHRIPRIGFIRWARGEMQNLNQEVPVT